MSQDIPVYLFTPAYPQARVGQGRVNLVLINDTIIHTGHLEDVAIPPVGVVLSLHPTLFENPAPKIQTGEKIRWRVEFCEEEHLQKSQLRWLYGGYNLLMLNGETLVKTSKQLEATFHQEGWYLPQSMRTQETQLHNLSRQPRIILGTTEQGKIFLLTISGRTQISCGASHIESVQYCQHLLQRDGDRPYNLINLDGGASVFLEAVENGQRHILNFPAPSDLNPAGIIRPNSAFLKIVRQREQ